jgi:nucleotide-binding universal stress UspA family protein
MSHDVVVGVDSSDASRRAVLYACDAARAGASVLLCHVIPWSPFSFTTADENEHRHSRKEQELAAATEQILGPMAALAKDCGVTVDVVARHGQPAETLLEIVAAEGAGLVVVGRTGDSALRGRVFGTLAGHLIQESPVPVTVVP